MPIVLVTQEAEFRRVKVQSQPEKTETLSQNTENKTGMVEWFKM
jgi:hypothetical protein